MPENNKNGRVKIVDPDMAHLVPLHLTLAECATVPPYTSRKRNNAAYRATEFECYPFYKQICRCVPLEMEKGRR